MSCLVNLKRLILSKIISVPVIYSALMQQFIYMIIGGMSIPTFIVTIPTSCQQQKSVARMPPLLTMSVKTLVTKRQGG